MLHELDTLAEEFDSLPDSFSRYAYLVELAALLPEPPEGFCTPERRFSGCQSNVWLQVTLKSGTCQLTAFSDTLILRGILYLFSVLLEGERGEAVLEADFDLLQRLRLGEHFNSQRTAGIKNLLTELKRQIKAPR